MPLTSSPVGQTLYLSVWEKSLVKLGTQNNSRLVKKIMASMRGITSSPALRFSDILRASSIDANTVEQLRACQDLNYCVITRAR